MKDSSKLSYISDREIKNPKARQLSRKSLRSKNDVCIILDR